MLRKQADTATPRSYRHRARPRLYSSRSGRMLRDSASPVACAARCAPDTRPEEEVHLVAIVSTAAELDVADCRGPADGTRLDVVELDETRRVTPPAAAGHERAAASVTAPDRSPDRRWDVRGSARKARHRSWARRRRALPPLTRPHRGSHPRRSIRADRRVAKRTLSLESVIARRTTGRGRMGENCLDNSFLRSRRGAASIEWSLATDLGCWADAEVGGARCG